MAAFGDPYEYTVYGRLFGQLVINRFFYQLSTVGNPDQLCVDSISDFDDNFSVAISAILSTEYATERSTLVAIDSDVDFAEHSYVQAGTVSGDCLPPFSAWSFIYNRASRESRNGWKRLAGVPESMQSNGVATSGALADLADSAIILGRNVTSDTNAYRPVIWRGPRPGLSVGVGFVVASVSYHSLGTQNSRKIGRGA